MQRQGLQVEFSLRYPDTVGCLRGTQSAWLPEQHFLESALCFMHLCGKQPDRPSRHNIASIIEADT